MALFQHLYSVPLARAIRLRTLTSVSAATASPPPLPPKKSSAAASRVLLGMSEEDLQQLALQFGQEKFRGKQLHHLLYKRKIKEIQDFAQVPLAFRNDLQKEGWKVGRLPVYKSITAADGTIKLLLQLEDNLLVETVGIPVGDVNSGSIRLTACVSSQVGCPLRCSFCATGKGGFSRNLKSQEIVEQVLAIEDVFNHRVTNVVFMGMGEPMLNLKEVIEAHRCLNKDVQIGQRMITISTVGVPNTIKRLATYKLQSTLALSLHAPNQKLREQIVPSAKSYPLDAIMKDCRDYFEETSRRVSFEYTLLAGVNDSVEQATELAELLHQWGRGHHVNLIPFNTVEGSEYKRPSKNRVHAFVNALESRKITVSVRQTRGLDASAACGQLRNEFQKTPLLVPSIDKQHKKAVAAVVPSAGEEHKTAVSAMAPSASADEQHETSVSPVVPSVDGQHGTAVSTVVPSAGERHKTVVSAMAPSASADLKHETEVSAVVPSANEQHETAVSAVVPSADEQHETAISAVVPSADEQHKKAAASDVIPSADEELMPAVSAVC